MSEKTVRQLFHKGCDGDKAFAKAFRGCTMLVIEDEAYLPMCDVKDFMTYSHQKY